MVSSSSLVFAKDSPATAPASINSIAMGQSLDTAIESLEADAYDVQAYTKTFQAALDKPITYMIKAGKKAEPGKLESDVIAVWTAGRPAADHVGLVYRNKTYDQNSRPSWESFYQKISDLSGGKPNYVTKSKLSQNTHYTIGFQWNKKGKARKPFLGGIEKISSKRPVMTDCMKLAVPHQVWTQNNTKFVDKARGGQGNFNSTCRSAMVLDIWVNNTSLTVEHYSQLLLDNRLIAKDKKAQLNWLHEQSDIVRANVKENGPSPDL